MVFNSIQFACFLTVVFFVYWSVSQTRQWTVLLIASYLFYALCGPKYILLILLVTGISYGTGRILSESTQCPRLRKWILTLGISIIIGILCFYKYIGFLWENTSRILTLFHIHTEPWITSFVLPAGISFYSFASVGYMVDVYRGTVSAEKNFGAYALFVSFFPTVLSGPIERSNNLLPQLKKGHNFDAQLATYGLREILYGLFKKMVIADSLAVYVNQVFDSVYSYQGFALILATVFYAIQIYCDFSGYSDIAIGVAKLFGIQLRPNFRNPYFADSIKDFWGRWHISLSTWFRDYVYIPLGGNRVHSLRHKMNLILTFMVSGLWHGASWNYIVWGLVHGIMQAVEASLPKKEMNRCNRFVRRTVVLLAVLAAWVFFRARTMADAMFVFSNCLVGCTDIVNYIASGVQIIGGVSGCIWLCIPLAVWCVMEFACRKENFCVSVDKLSPVIRWLLYILIAFLIIFFTPVVSTSEFVYFQF